VPEISKWILDQHRNQWQWIWIFFSSHYLVGVKWGLDVTSPHELLLDWKQSYKVLINFKQAAKQTAGQPNKQSQPTELENFAQFMVAVAWLPRPLFAAPPLRYSEPQTGGFCVCLCNGNKKQQNGRTACGEDLPRFVNTFQEAKVVAVTLHVVYRASRSHTHTSEPSFPFPFSQKHWQTKAEQKKSKK